MSNIQFSNGKIKSELLLQNLNKKFNLKILKNRTCNCMRKDIEGILPSTKQEEERTNINHENKLREMHNDSYEHDN